MVDGPVPAPARGRKVRIVRTGVNEDGIISRCGQTHLQPPERLRGANTPHIYNPLRR